MKNVFIRTKNVKQFAALMDELPKLPSNVSKIALVYGSYGLGKSETIQWWVDKNDSVYVRAKQGMTAKWLLTDIATELDLSAYGHTQERYDLVENYLKRNSKIIIIDEVDYLIDKQTIEVLRDLHDKTGSPIVLVGMENVDKKLARFPHLMDRVYKTLKFEHFNENDIREIIKQITDLEFTEDAILYLATRTNQFRQLIKLINKLEKLAKTNQLKDLDEITVKGILNERTYITTLQKVG